MTDEKIAGHATGTENNSSQEWGSKMDAKAEVPVMDETDEETGHMQELEVDVSQILKDAGLEDIEGDQSPYPEGIHDILPSQTNPAGVIMDCHLTLL